ncbi:hypothetical protein TNCV_4128831 [Trichonephila clavipes]|nr:hypothetical protein TNCV_4128831 [Trichonephila clavipes]
MHWLARSTSATQGLLVTDIVILNHSQVKSTPELVRPLQTSTPCERKDFSRRPSGIVVSDADSCVVGPGFESRGRHGCCKCIVPSRHGGTLNIRRVPNPLVRLVEGEERGRQPLVIDPPPDKMMLGAESVGLCRQLGHSLLTGRSNN